jgi:hypothetical protein
LSNDIGDMSYGDRRRLFTRLLAKLITKAEELGYELAVCPDGREHKPNSLHFIGLAVDFDLYINGDYQKSTEAHRPLGEYWESLHPLCRWGGRFEEGDGNHYSVTYGGRR